MSDIPKINKDVSLLVPKSSMEQMLSVIHDLTIACKTK